MPLCRPKRLDPRHSPIRRGPTRRAPRFTTGAGLRRRSTSYVRPRRQERQSGGMRRRTGRAVRRPGSSAGSPGPSIHLAANARVLVASRSERLALRSTACWSSSIPIVSRASSGTPPSTGRRESCLPRVGGTSGRWARCPTDGQGGRSGYAFVARSRKLRCRAVEPIDPERDHDPRAHLSRCARRGELAE